jgi:hypothetical protein
LIAGPGFFFLRHGRLPEIIGMATLSIHYPIQQAIPSNADSSTITTYTIENVYPARGELKFDIFSCLFKEDEKVMFDS